MSRDHNNTVTMNVSRSEQHDGDGFPYEGSLDDLISTLASIRESIPKEFRKNATCEIGSESGYEGSHRASVVIEYWRPMTDDEREARDKSAEQRLAGQRARDLIEYQRLRERLGLDKAP